MNTTTVGINSNKFKSRTGRNKDKDIIKCRRENNAIYNDTAMGAIIDSRVNTFLGSGYTLYAPANESALKEQVQEELDRMGFDREFPTALKEGYKNGYGWMEIAPTISGGVALIARSTENILPIHDPESGDIIGWRQVFGDNAPSVEINASQAIVIVPIPALKKIGVSLIERAKKEIDAHETMNESSAEAIHRMGYPSMEINIESGADIPVDVPQRIGEEYQRGRGPASDFVTAQGTKMIEHSINGVSHVRDYQDWALLNMAIVTGTPPSEVGIAENSEATANRHYQAYYKRISAEQSVVTSQVQEQIINNLILRRLGRDAGTITFEWDNPDGEDLKRRADTVKLLMSVDPMNPYAIITAQQAGEFVLGKKYVTEDNKADKEAQQEIARANQAIRNAVGGAPYG